jgi:hypothetical protein
VCTLNELRSLVLVLCVATLLVAIAQEEKKCPPRETYKSLRYDEDWSALRDPDCRIEAIAEEYADLIIEWWEGGYERSLQSK